MIKYLSLLFFFFTSLLNRSFSQSPLHAEELQKVQNPYSAVLPKTFCYSFSLEPHLRDIEYKPAYELFEYFNSTDQEWQPAFKFEYDYMNTGNLSVKNEYSYDLSSFNWINSDRLTFAYDSYGFQMQAIEETYNILSGGLSNYALYEQQHQLSGSLLQEKISYWDLVQAAWLINHKHDYTYDANDHETSIIHANWDETSSDWSPYEEYFSSYDASENLVSYQGHTWNADSAKWLNLTLDTMIYDVSNYRTHDETLLWSLPLNEWSPFFANDYEYDGGGNLISITSMLWDSASQQFQNSTQYQYEFNSGMLISSVFQTWNTTQASWINFIKTEFLYDSNHLLIQKIIDNWDGSNWITSYQYLYTNDLNGNVLESVGQTWNAGNGSWINIERYTAEWSSFITGMGEENFMPAFFVFPNPANDFVFISGLQKQRDYFLKITALNGQEGESIHVRQETPLFLGGLTNGIYLVELEDENRHTIGVQKLVIGK